MVKLTKLFEEFLEEQKQEKALESLTLVLEHHTYKRIPGTNNSYREDSPRTSTKTQRHAHVYAKQNGNGKELYSVNLSGSGHDGSSGKEIPKTHAEFFRGQGYDIPLTNVLESISIDPSVDDGYELLIFEESET